MNASTQTEFAPVPSMSAASWLNRKRLELIGLMSVGGTGGAGLLFGLLELMPAAWLGSPDAFVRLGHTLVVASLPSIVVMLQVSLCFRLFDNEHALDPLSARESRRYKISARALTNSVEQAVVFLPPLIALGLMLEGEAWRWVPALAITWAVGRILFVLGYQVRVALRAPGMVITLVAALSCFGLLASSLR